MRPLVAILVLMALALAAPSQGGAVPLHPGVAGADATAQATLERAVAAGLDRPAARTARLPTAVLVLLAECSDRPHTVHQTREALHALFFAGAPSVSDYYRRASYGRYVPAGTTTAWQRLQAPQSFYADGSRGIGGAAPHNARTLVADAVRAADPHLDFSRFDNDGADGVPSSGDDDGMVDALVVVHAGGSAETSGDANDLLSHSWFTEGTVPTADGVFVWAYALVAATSPLGVHVHEIGHLLGLPDLYNRRAVSRRAPGGLGDWSVMATGAWLGNGDQPGDLDGPSKIELGFVDAIVPTQAASALALTAADGDTPPTLYKVWTYGRPGAEYFVIENRRPAGLDAALPGGGMLVYHVDLTRASNDDAQTPRVRLLQADGRDDLEGFRNAGDAGDPYPGTGSDCCRLGTDTYPGTRGADGSDTQIEITHISTPTATMHFDLRLETRASLHVVRHALREIQGNGDGDPAPGEELELELEVENVGLAITGVEFRWRSQPPEDVTWSTDAASVEMLGKGERTTNTFVLRAAATLGDPATLVLYGTARDATGATYELQRQVGLGRARGFLACLEPRPSRFTRDCADPDGAWSVQVLRGQGSWTLHASPGDLAHVYRNATSGRYPNASDVALVSPAFNLETGSTVHLLHAYETEDFQAGWAHDGGRVEIALDGGPWEALVPRRGYPRRLFPESVPHLAGAGVFAGSAARRWDLLDCGARTGSARLRFRFASSDSIGAPGWEIARVDVQVESPVVAPSGLSLLAEPNPARFPTRIAFRIAGALNLPALPTRLELFDARGRLVRSLSHAPVPAQSAQFTWDGTDRAGHAVPSGVYCARLEWGGRTAATKLLVLR